MAQHNDSTGVGLLALNKPRQALEVVRGSPKEHSKYLPKMLCLGDESVWNPIKVEDREAVWLDLSTHASPVAICSEWQKESAVQREGFLVAAEVLGIFDRKAGKCGDKAGRQTRYLCRQKVPPNLLQSRIEIGVRNNTQRLSSQNRRPEVKDSIRAQRSMKVCMAIRPQNLCKAGWQAKVVQDLCG